MNKLTDKHISLINKQIANSENQSFIQVKEKTLEMIVNQVYETEPDSGAFIYGGIIDKAVAYGVLIAGQRPFSEFNIKTAIVTIITFLNMNNEVLEISDEDIINLSNLLKKPESIEIYDWIASHIKKQY